MSDLLAAGETAAHLRLKAATIRLWTREGLVPAIKITGKVIRYDLDQVMEALRHHAQRRDVKVYGPGGGLKKAVARIADDLRSNNAGVAE